MTTSPTAATSVGVDVDVDVSRDSTRAVQWAASDAARRHRRLHLVHACDWPQYVYPPVGLALPVSCQEDAQEASTRILANAVVQARDVDADLRITTETIVQRPVLALDASRQATLVVVGSRGLGGFAALLVGSTGVQLAAHATCPVVIVRRREGPDGPNAGRVVFGVDGPHNADDALEFAFEQAAFRDTGLTAVHAYQLPVAVEPGDMAPLAYNQDDLHDEERRVLSESLAGWREKYPEVEVRLDITPGRAGGVLAEASAGAELLVVGARGHGGFTGLLLGSVSQAVIHHAPCPIAVVHQPYE